MEPCPTKAARTSARTGEPVAELASPRPTVIRTAVTQTGKTRLLDPPACPDLPPGLSCRTLRPGTASTPSHGDITDQRGANPAGPGVGLPGPTEEFPWRVLSAPARRRAGLVGGRGLGGCWRG